jgi:hypothetical protein
LTADDYALPAELEALLPEVCDRHGVPAREHDLIRQLLSTAEAQWPACCRGDCSPCVDEHKAVARTILVTAASRSRP